MPVRVPLPLGRRTRPFILRTPQRLVRRPIQTRGRGLTHSRDRFTTHLILGVFFASGAAGLIYEILWMRQLAQLFGSTSQSAAVTTAAFFIGISAGSYYWGHRAAQLASPRRT